MSKVIIILSLFFAFFFIGFAWLFSDLIDDVDEISFDSSTCGDGSLEGTCSANKPYYCSDGILVERASVCGCPSGLIQNKDSCISKFQTNPKIIHLKYTLRGEEYSFNYTTYKGMVDYLSE